jgi:hypothetical protein
MEAYLLRLRLVLRDTAVRTLVLVSITTHRGIGAGRGHHYHALMDPQDGSRPYAEKFAFEFQANAWVLLMAKKHFPLKKYRLVQATRPGPWLYSEDAGDGR